MIIRPRLPMIATFRCTILFAGLLSACQIADAQRSFVSFDKVTIDEEMRGGYGVEVADMDGDGLTDIIALATNPAQFVWYKNPGWEKYTISTVAQRNIDSAPLDIDKDGDMDIVLASEFALGESTTGGLVHWLENPGNPTVNQEWAMHYIDEMPTSHRIKWGDINGDGEMELVNLPIIGEGASAPLYDVDLRLKAYPIPPELDVDNWPGIVIDQSLQLAHGLAVHDWEGDGRDDLLTASFDGVHLFQLASQGVNVAKTQLGTGKQDAERPQIGSSEVDVGLMGDQTPYIATVEPWHGNQVVVYEPAENGSLWQRRVIDTGLANGHGLLTADLDNDGSDEIVAGGRSDPYKLAIFRHGPTEDSWQRINLDDDNVAVSGLAIEDLNGDGYLDIVAIGGGTRNVVYYENSGP